MTGATESDSSAGGRTASGGRRWIRLLDNIIRLPEQHLITNLISNASGNPLTADDSPAIQRFWASSSVAAIRLRDDDGNSPTIILAQR